MKKIILASHNLGKVREFKSMFDSKEITIVSLDEAGYDLDIEETGTTFAENALIKAKTIAEAMNMITIADDSGLEVYALNMAPGVYSARYAGGHDDLKNNELLLKNLKGIENRKARYVCDICIYNPNGEYRIVSDTCEGIIIDTKRGSNGFGYDPYFYFPKINKTFAEISLEEKNLYSHRAKAIRKLKEIVNKDFTFKE